MEYLENIRTQFLKERVGETEWENRQYIVELEWLERIVEKHGPHSMMEAMAFHALKNRYPVEYECIKRELHEGIKTSPEEFLALRQEWQRQKMADEKEKSALSQRQKQARLETQEREYELWVQMGGKP